MTLISARDSVHDFIVKFSSKSVCSVVVSLAGEMAAQSLAYHAHGTADNNKSSCYHRTLNQQCMLAQGHLINHLIRYYVWFAVVFGINGE